MTTLGSALAEGRLTLVEFEDRADAASTARWRDDLDALVADLPAPGLPVPHAPITPAGAGLPATCHSTRPSEARIAQPTLLRATT